MSRRESEPETIEVRPPEPFAGRALYSRITGAANWTGNLRVDLPGIDGAPLTGPGFSAAFCRGTVGSCLYGSDPATSP